jgi:3',5'-cyclic AMP phosphodiesterase CpdA
MSWYFDTENWAAGIWNSWAEARTDTWREAMVRAIAPAEAGEPADERFAVFPPGVDQDQDFTFLVIGDTGEGDASQHVLRDQYLQAVRRDEVKFVVVSSDVVYPTGAMRDYELKFWLPFKGTNKPVYAIPGNHDWYDALEGFAATFLEPDAARRAMQARLEVDRGLSSTNDRRIEQYLAEAARLEQEYEVPVRQQAGPFFQVQTPQFALFAVDTGVARRVDPEQWDWLVAALEASRGKTKMAILGHPFYAGGRFVAEGSPDFVRLHDLLREHGVAIVMAGDTHDLEFYREPGGRGSDPALHFVNGGGGAYLSFGTPLDWPAEAATADWAIHPSREQVVAKIDATTPVWKWPVWWWTRQFGAWPFSAELLSAAFDANVAPFYQSFCEIRVEVSQRRVRIIPWGVHGPLHWRDLQTSEGLLPAGTGPDTPVEWIVPFETPGNTPGSPAGAAGE